MPQQNDADDYAGLPAEVEDDDDPVCNECGGSGWVVFCIDDMCQGAGECMHGDGEGVCPSCHGRNLL